MPPSIPFYHVRNPSVYVPLETVLKTNNTTDGYYIPQQIPILSDSLIYKNPPPSFRDIAFEVFRSFFRDVIPESDLYTIIAHAFSFKVPVFPIDPRTYILELTHGDSGSYTDFGARFTAQLIAYFHRRNDIPLHILFTGDELETLSLARAFSEFEDIHASFLYSKNDFQNMIKQQFSSLPKHIHMFEVDNPSTDCQAIVQKTLADTDITRSMELFVPHVAHVGFLLSQVCCCIYAALTVLSRAGYDNSIEKPQLIIGVPLKQPNAVSAAILAKKMGAPISGFIATADSSCSTPENTYREECTRLKMLYAHGSPERHTPEVALFRFSQDSVLDAIRDCNDRTGYVVSPAIAEVWWAWSSIKNGFSETDETIESLCSGGRLLPQWLSDDYTAQSCITVIPEISHPAFYAEAIRTATGRYPSVPNRFEYTPQINRDPVIECSSAQDLKDWLLSLV